jgi:hypothetical protein
MTACVQDLAQPVSLEIMSPGQTAESASRVSPWGPPPLTAITREITTSPKLNRPMPIMIAECRQMASASPLRRPDQRPHDVGLVVGVFGNAAGPFPPCEFPLNVLVALERGVVGSELVAIQQCGLLAELTVAADMQAGADVRSGPDQAHAA